MKREEKGNIVTYDYEEADERRLDGRDGFMLAEAFVFESEDLREQKRWILVAVTGQDLKRQGFDWQNAFREGRAMRDKLADRFRGLGPVGEGDVLHWWPDPVD